MSVRIVQVDAFTSEPYKGNPAAVCVLAAGRGAEWMQDVAREMNLSETAFLVPNADGSFQLRWFTPAVEVDLCGHATLAAAHVLWEDNHLPRAAQARLHTRSGLLTAGRNGEWIELNFPAKSAEPIDPPDGLLEALGCDAVALGRNQFDYLVEVGDEATLRSLRPDHSRLARLPVRGIIVTSLSSQYDFVSRFFAPGSGIDEDPVTGSAHCCLGPYWMKKTGKSDFLAYQASVRGGVVKVRVEGDRVHLGGQAITVFRGDLVV